MKAATIQRRGLLLAGPIAVVAALLLLCTAPALAAAQRTPFAVLGNAPQRVAAPNPNALETELYAADGVSDEFGYSVALSGNTALIGAPDDTVGSNADQGAVYVFTRSDSSWTQVAKLTASDGAAGHQFGSSVAISGDTVLVGAPRYQVDEQGIVYVFTGSGASWTQQAELTANDGAARDDFGSAIATNGGTALVGAPDHTVGSNYQQGVAYVFAGSGANWTQQAELTASDTAAGDQFGFSVALNGGAALVGAPDHEVGSTVYQGAAYIFTSSTTNWNQQAELTASDGAPYDLFGTSVALDGDTSLVGAPGATDIVLTGHTYVFTGSGASWNQQAELTDDGQLDNFGDSVALDGDTALVGAPEFNALGQGCSYTFRRSGTNWTMRRPALIAINGAAGDQFGSSVALDGNTALLGAYDQALGGGYLETGVAYVNLLPADNIAAPTVTGMPTLGQTLACSTGGWTDNPTPTYAYQWLRNGTAIGGATSASYLVAKADCGYGLACQVTATNSAGQASATSNALTVGPAPSVVLKLSAQKLAVGKHVTISGTVTNFLSSAKAVSICRKLSGRLILLKRLTISSSGTFRWTMKASKPGKLVLVATYRAAGATLSSNASTLTVRQPAAASSR